MINSAIANRLKRITESTFMDQVVIGTPAARVNGLENVIFSYTDAAAIPCTFYPDERVRHAGINVYHDLNRLGRLLVATSTPEIPIGARLSISSRNDNTVSHEYFNLSPVTENRFYSLYFIEKVPPVKHNCSITIYNKYIVNRDAAYQRMQINNVVWEEFKESIATGEGVLLQNKINLYIPYLRGTDYLDPVTWNALTTKTGKFTFQSGDIVVKGLVSDTISTGFTITDLKAKYDKTAVIRNVESIEAGVDEMRMWKIGAA